MRGLVEKRFQSANGRALMHLKRRWGSLSPTEGEHRKLEITRQRLNLYSRARTRSRALKESYVTSSHSCQMVQFLWSNSQLISTLQGDEMSPRIQPSIRLQNAGRDNSPVCMPGTFFCNLEFSFTEDNFANSNDENTLYLTHEQQRSLARVKQRDAVDPSQM